MANTLQAKWKKKAGEDSDLPSIYQFYNQPLIAGLWVLFVSKRFFGTDYLSYDEIENILQEHLDLSVSASALKKAFANSRKKVIRRKDGNGLKISDTGERYLLSFKKEEPLTVVYVEPKTPRTAKKNLESLISSIPRSALLIADPYYGLQTFEVLAMFLKHHDKINFLTAVIGHGEKSTSISQALKDLKTEFGNKIELRVVAGKDLHDRYIIAKDTFFIVGQGIKDLGNKESLLIAVDNKMGKEIRNTLESNFLARWASATPLV